MQKGWGLSGVCVCVGGGGVGGRGWEWVVKGEDTENGSYNLQNAIETSTFVHFVNHRPSL